MRGLSESMSIVDEDADVAALQCPFDAGALTNGSGLLTCPTCNREFNRVDDSDFVQAPTPYWGELPREKMIEILEIARTRNYKDGLLEAERADSDLYYYLLSASRADWVLPALYSSGRQVCVDIGSGWGTTTFLVAPYYKSVYSVDIVPERLEFQRIRKRQEQAANVRLVRASFSGLPFRENSIDFAIANGILEWVPTEVNNGRPRDLQVDFLAKVRRFLKPGGALCIGIENRMGFQYWMGAKDHSGLPFTSLMPRSVASVFTRLRPRKTYSRETRLQPHPTSYRGFTYTLRGYQRLLADAGFGTVEIYWVYPSYNYPRLFASLDQPGALSFMLKQAADHDAGPYAKLKSLALKATKRVPPAALLLGWRAFTPHFLIYAGKATTKAPTTSAMSRVARTNEWLFHAGSDKWDSAASIIALEDGRPRGRVRLRRKDISADFERSGDGIREPWIPGRIAKLRLE